MKKNKKYSALDKVCAGNKDMVLKAVVASTVNSLINILGVILIYQALNITLGALVDGKDINFTNLWIVCACFVPVVGLYILTETWSYNSSYTAAYKMSAKGRIQLSNKLKDLPLGYIKSRDPGDLSNAIMNDFSMVEHAVSHALAQLISSIIVPCIVFIVLLCVNWKMGLAMISTLPIALLIVFATSKFQNKISKKQASTRIRAANRLQEYLSGIKHIKSNNLSVEKFDRLNSSMKDLMKQSIMLEAILAPIVMASSLILRASMIVMTIVGSYMLMGNELTFMTFVGFLLLSATVYVPITNAFSDLALIRYSTSSGERILEILDIPSMQGDGDAPIGNKIIFKDVVFRYKDVDVLKNVNISINQGEVTALVGPSGSGKTTLTKIAARFWDVDSGSITMDGIDIRNINPDKYLEKFSEVFQDTYLFEDTIGANIGFGKASGTQEEIINASIAANCHDFISRLPNGYDTVVGEGGATLSGGEKQRIAIARALIKDAPIIILDEATASLDATNEMAVQSAINNLVKNRTVIVIAHKLKTVRNADKIIVLDKGEIIEQGTHDNLLKNNSMYKKLWDIQSYV